MRVARATRDSMTEILARRIRGLQVYIFARSIRHMPSQREGSRSPRRRENAASDTCDCCQQIRILLDDQHTSGPCIRDEAMGKLKLGPIFFYISQRWTDDKDGVYRQNFETIFRTDLEACLAFLEGGSKCSNKSLEAWYFAGQDLRAAEIVMGSPVLAKLQDPERFFKKFSTGLKKDRSLMTALVANNGLFLRFVHPSLRDNPDIICAAVKQNSGALAYVPKPATEESGKLFLMLQAIMPPNRRNSLWSWASFADAVVIPSEESTALMVDVRCTLCSVCFVDFVQLRGIPRQCANGHLICGPCLGKLIPESKAPCPTCRTAVPRAAYAFNSFLEEALQSRKVLCPLGCLQVLSGKNAILEHMQKACVEREIACPTCDIDMKRSELKAHCVREHVGTGRWTLKLERPEKLVWLGRSMASLHDASGSGIVHLKHAERSSNLQVVKVRLLLLFGSAELSVMLTAEETVNERQYETTSRLYLLPGIDQDAFVAVHGPLTTEVRISLRALSL